MGAETLDTSPALHEDCSNDDLCVPQGFSDGSRHLVGVAAKIEAARGCAGSQMSGTLNVISSLALSS